MADDNRLLELQFEHVNDRLDKYDQLFGKLFDSMDEIRVVMERNTLTVEQHHRRSLALEKLQCKIQRRTEIAEKELVGMKDVIAHISEDLTPVKTQVDEMARWFSVFTGIPGAIKFFSLVFGFIIGGYGVYAIVHDSLSFLHK